MQGQIIITGDITLDKNIYKGNRHSPEDKEIGTRIEIQRGGAYIIYDILKRIDGTTKEMIKRGEKRISEMKDRQSLPAEELKILEKEINEIKLAVKSWKTRPKFGLKLKIFSWKSIPKSLVTYAAWERNKYSVPKEFEKVLGKNINAWKVSLFLGFGTEKSENQVDAINQLYKNYKFDINNAGILVFDDGGNNFRNEEEAWKSLLYETIHKSHEQIPRNDLKNIIIKIAYPVAQGKLFTNLISDFKEKLTIIVSIDEIRKEDVLVSKGVSWEQTAIDLVHELKYNYALKLLLECRYLIVTFRSEGALYLEMQAGEICRCRLVFDPLHLEGEWSKDAGLEGEVIGLMSCFTAGVVYGFVEQNFNLEDTVSRALSMMRIYQVTGHGEYEDQPGFPVDKIAEEIILPNSKYASAFVPLLGSNECRNFNEDVKLCNSIAENESNFHNLNWSILEGNYLAGSPKEPLYDTACRFALFGERELANSPVLKMNKFITYDRREIEALRNVINLAKDYLRDQKVDRPLSIGVFGSPGSGKSFAVEQLAKHLQTEFMEFNLSQFVDVHELEGAFHQVRDIVLKGKTPVVFWDEFDSQAYRWLQFLLAPMQDGKFQEGQITHPIGKCIFVFAGGTSYSYETFGVLEPEYPKPVTPEGKKINKNDYEKKIREYELNLTRRNDFMLKKGPDFKSRLSGYLSIQGPNQLECLDEYGEICKDEDGNTIHDQDDIFFPIRRALFIRGRLGIKGSEELKIDYGLLNALIRAKKYENGSRSLQKVLSFLKTNRKDKFQRSNLPHFSVMSMLVDFSEFINLMDQDKTYDFKVYKIAPNIHTKWMEIADKQGWKMDYHKEYNYLPAHMIDENIAAARRIPDILQRAGCKITYMESERIKFNITILQENEIRRLAEAICGITPAKMGKLIIKDIISEVKKINDINKTKLIDEFNTKLALSFELAKLEHSGWCDNKKKHDWTSKEVRNDDRKWHNCLISYNKLKEKDKSKDIDAIINIEENLEKAGVYIKTLIHRELLEKVNNNEEYTWKQYERVNITANRIEGNNLETPDNSYIILINGIKYSIEGINKCPDESIFEFEYELEELNGKCLFKSRIPQVWVVQIKEDFFVEHPVLGLMKGNKDDYLVKRDNEQTFPDVWIVSKEFFENTIKRGD